MSNNQEHSIELLVEALPEVYQPIFNHPELSAQASRTCFDRLKNIVSAYNYISNEKGRPLKVLDLGCAQGFFSLNLASLGALVTGVDYSQPNIDVCNKLAAENTNLEIKFLLGSIETIVEEKIDFGEYDLVLGLSVFHHLVFEHGVEFVLHLFEVLSKKIETGIFEFALDSEPLYWAESQHAEPREFIEYFNYQHQLSMYGTHLSAVERPLFFASNKYWNIDSDYGVIDHFSKQSHQLDESYHNGNRRYYFSGDKIIKIFINSSNYDDWTELNNEYNFLLSPVEGYRTPEIIHYGSNTGESWLVRKIIPGTLLLDKLIGKEDFDDLLVIEQVLQQLACLERNGLYHNDLRPWNILIGQDGNVYIIDYGSISDLILDGDDLYGQMLSLFILIREIACHEVRNTHSRRPQFISPTDFPVKYKAWLNSIWCLPSAEWNFRTIYDHFLNHKNTVVSEISNAATSHIIEGYLSSLTNHLHWQMKYIVDNALNKVEAMNGNNTIATDSCIEVKNEFANLYKDYSEKVNLLTDKIDADNIFIINSLEELKKSISENRVEFLKEDQHVTLNSVNHEDADILRAELDDVYGSKSWKITYPLRFISKILRTLISPRRLNSALKLRFKKKSKTFINEISRFVQNRPGMKRRVISVLNKHPGLKFKIKQVLAPETIHLTSALNSAYVEGDVVIENAAGNYDSNNGRASKANRGYNNQGMHEDQKSILESWFY